MVNLSLAGCRSMTLLKLSCPNLQNVNLDGCDHLERASFCPVSVPFFFICLEGANIFSLELVLNIQLI